MKPTAIEKDTKETIAVKWHEYIGITDYGGVDNVEIVYSKEAEELFKKDGYVIYILKNE